MRFLMLIRIENNADYENSKPLPPGLDEAMGELIGEWSKSGAFISAEGLKPTSHASRVRLERGKVMLTDGPFTESKEVIGGFFLLEVADRATAVDLTRQFVEVHRRLLGDSFLLECEVRQVDG
ncbi:MAG: transcriptional regulator [Myxococcales bacterium]|nr:MAG: transcriptional regulator [Myxococcales bacterium]